MRRAGRTGKKGALEQALETEIESNLSRLLGRDAPAGLALEALEHDGRQIALHTEGRLIEQHLNADTSDYKGATLPCACEGAAHYAGRREKSFTSSLGRLRLSRAYYHCADCNSGFYPRDREQGLEGGSLTPGATRMVGYVAAGTSFDRSSGLLRELAGLFIGAKQVERTAEALGVEIACDEREQVEAAEPVSGPMYLGLDGTGLPVRPSECEGRPGKQPDDSAKTREVKLVTGWTAARAEPQETAQRDSDSVSYSAAVESAACRDTDRELSPFAQRVARETKRLGFDQARFQVVLGDGALWIWNLVSELFPRAVQIVDLFHAMERLWKVAHEIYGRDNDLGAARAHARCAELEASRIDAVLAALRKHAEAQPEAAAAVKHFDNNRHRMRYAKFRKMGLCVSSGVVESGCKRVVGERLKRGGMHWTVDGGNAIIALKCYLLSGRFEEFWARRARSNSRLVVALPTDDRPPESVVETGNPEQKYAVGGR